jgi:outer membrane protein assembly factor BamB
MRPLRQFAISLFVCAVFSPEARADWPNFRGPDHNGISAETGIKTQWTQAPAPSWEFKIGPGFSSMAAIGDRIYTCGTVKDRQVLYCLNADTGEVIWENAFEEQFKNEFGDGARSTPTVDGDRVYILGANGTMLCVKADTGEEVWKKEFHTPPTWAYSGSVLIEGRLAIASAGAKEGSLVAFDKMTGKREWKCGKDPVGYATPYPFTFEGERYIAGFTGTSLIIADAKTGKQVYRKEWKTSYNINAAAPIYHDGHLWIGSAYRQGCSLLKLSKKGKKGDKLDAETVWESKDIQAKFQSPILHKGHLYLSDEKSLMCVDFMTGEERWRKHRIKDGTIVLADGHIYVLGDDGTLQVADAKTDAFEPTASAEILSGKCWTVPVLHRGRLFARNLDRLVCVDLRENAGADGRGSKGGTEGR